MSSYNLCNGSGGGREKGARSKGGGSRGKQLSLKFNNEIHLARAGAANSSRKIGKKGAETGCYTGCSTTLQIPIKIQVTVGETSNISHLPKHVNDT